ncbi:hypothetical protein QWZ06_14095 [Chryseobacterium tructae]|uniref:Uncharacterized protein n=1 Tax=Chryseobacterium tructae TaxID=1037380 RepID=A0ABV7XZ67_9FLAO|nr:hypothetical protein [Chryseobacterium tructae]MDN3693337.1 hypothetical protein [Chryseobacterium tructae]
MLTGKAKQDFENWMKDKLLLYTENKLRILVNTFEVALVIEWLDTIPIIITINNEYYDGFHFYWQINRAQPLRSDHVFPTREQATISAIEKANEIYNSR